MISTKTKAYWKKLLAYSNMKLNFMIRSIKKRKKGSNKKGLIVRILCFL